MSGWPGALTRATASWRVGIEGLPHRVERRDAELLEHAQQLALDQLDAGGDGGGAGLGLGRLQGALEVVEHGQDLAEQGLVGVAGVVLALARRALLGIVELGQGPQGPVLVRLGLAGLGLERLPQPPDLLRPPRWSLGPSELVSS